MPQRGTESDYDPSLSLDGARARVFTLRADQGRRRYLLSPFLVRIPRGGSMSLAMSAPRVREKHASGIRAGMPNATQVALLSAFALTPHRVDHEHEPGDVCRVAIGEDQGVRAA